MKGLIVRLILSFVALAGLCGCDREYEGDLWFAGDSICHGWNVKSCFPDWRTHNYGVNGARIDRIEELAGVPVSIVSVGAERTATVTPTATPRLCKASRRGAYT